MYVHNVQKFLIFIFIVIKNAIKSHTNDSFFSSLWICLYSHLSMQHNRNHTHRMWLLLFATRPIFRRGYFSWAIYRSYIFLIRRFGSVACHRDTLSTHARHATHENTILSKSRTERFKKRDAQIAKGSRGWKGGRKNVVSSTSADFPADPRRSLLTSPSTTIPHSSFDHAISPLPWTNIFRCRRTLGAVN